MTKKMAPRRVSICPGCPSNELNLDVVPQFNFVQKTNDTRKVTIIDNVKSKIKNKISSLF